MNFLMWVHQGCLRMHALLLYVSYETGLLKRSLCIFEQRLFSSGIQCKTLTIRFKHQVLYGRIFK